MRLRSYASSILKVLYLLDKDFFPFEPSYRDCGTVAWSVNGVSIVNFLFRILSFSISTPPARRKPGFVRLRLFSSEFIASDSLIWIPTLPAHHRAGFMHLRIGFVHLFLLSSKISVLYFLISIWLVRRVAGGDLVIRRPRRS